MRENKGKMDMNNLFGFVIVDIIGDLTFGESFECLERSALNASTWSLSYRQLN